jgi:hypothetical protein
MRNVGYENLKITNLITSSFHIERLLLKTHSINAGGGTARRGKKDKGNKSSSQRSLRSKNRS